MKQLSETKYFKSFSERARQILKNGGTEISSEADERIKKEVEEEESINPTWIKKCFSKKEWGSFYMHNSSYCKLSEDSTGIWAGFCIVGKIPEYCYPLNDYELYQVDEYRKNMRVYPRPLEDSTKKQSAITIAT